MEQENFLRLKIVREKERAAAAEALGKISDERATGPLTVASKDKNILVGLAAAQALRMLNQKTTLDHMQADRTPTLMLGTRVDI